jgi:hypothetical protein
MTWPTWGKMANFAFALKRALLHLRREIGKQTFTLGANYFSFAPIDQNLIAAL